MAIPAPTADGLETASSTEIWSTSTKTLGPGGYRGICRGIYRDKGKENGILLFRTGLGNGVPLFGASCPGACMG